MYDTDCWGNFNYVPDFIRFRERWADYYCGDTDGWLLVWSDACILYLTAGIFIGALIGRGWLDLSLAPWFIVTGFSAPMHIPCRIAELSGRRKR